MPIQSKKDELARCPGDQNLWIYAGWLDIANATEDWDTALTLTKIYALFYERIIVFDGYFHCHGLLYEALKKASHANQNTSLGLREESLREHEILKLLYEGIVVPAHRKGSSMRDTFLKNERGIDPGKFLCVDRKSGDKVLQIADEVARYFYVQPGKDLGPNTSIFHKALWDLLTDEHTFMGCILASPHLFEEQGILRKDIAIRVRTIIDDFHDKLIQAKGDPNFRRGWVEEWAAEILQIPLHSYSSFNERMDYSSPDASAVESVVLTILNAVSTAYELMHADAFNCQAGLFTSHHRDIPESRIMRKLSTATNSNGPKIPRVYRLPEEQPRSVGLSAQDVVEFRQSDNFKKYCEQVRKLRIPSAGENLLEANPYFEHFFFDEYVKTIIELIRKSSNKSLSQPTLLQTLVNSGSFLLIYNSAFNYEAFDFLGLPISTLLRGIEASIGAAGLLTNAPVINQVFEKHLISRSVKRFKKNNYHLISS